MKNLLKKVKICAVLRNCMVYCGKATIRCITSLKSADLSSALQRKPEITYMKKVEKLLASGTACAVYMGNPLKWKMY